MATMTMASRCSSNDADDDNDNDTHNQVEYGVIPTMDHADESHYDRRRSSAAAAIGTADDAITTTTSSSAEYQDASSAGGRIHFSTKKLYGRQREVQTCCDMLESMLSNSNRSSNCSKTVFLEGYSGCGKSAVAREFLSRAQTDNKHHQNFWILQAKYEETANRLLPFAAIKRLFDTNNTMEAQHHDGSLLLVLKMIYYQMQDQLGEEDAQIIFKIFPTLKRLFRGEGNVVGSNASSQNGGGGSRTWSTTSSDGNNGKQQNQDDGGGASVSSISDSRHNTISSAEFHRHSYNNTSENSNPSSTTRPAFLSTKMDPQRLHAVLKFFFQALAASADRPLILFLDDLQWADDSSLDFLHALLVDEQQEQEQQYLFFLGAYRSNQVQEQPKLHALLQCLHHQASTSLQEDPSFQVVTLDALPQADVAEFIADSLQLPIQDIEPLAQTVYSKTMGNPFFTKQALEQLVRRNALYYDTISFVWAWNLEADDDNAKNILSDDLVDMVTCKIQELDPKVQQAVVVASCTLRATFDVETLQDLWNAIAQLDYHIPPNNKNGAQEEEKEQAAETIYSSRQELIDLLDSAVDQGLLVTNPQASNKYSFAHDRIQEAAYSFAQEWKYSRIKAIGQALHQRALSTCSQEDDDGGQEWMFFSACKHLNAVSCEEASTDENLARLNLRTAELSLELLAFESTIEFCTHGLAQLDSATVWTTHYDLAVRFHSMAAVALLGAGNADAAEAHCDEVLRHKKSITDALPVYKVYLDCLSVHGKKQQVFDINFMVLKELGISFPESEKMQKLKAWMALKQVKGRYIPTEKDINGLPRATDPLAIDTMEFLQKAGASAYAVSKIPLYVLTCCESIRGMTKHGLTDSSATAMASFANVLMHIYGDFDASVRLADLVLVVANRYKNKYSETRALNTANNNVLAWVRPLKTRLKYHVRAYESGRMLGNLEGATVGQWYSFCVRLYAAMPLAPIEADFRRAISEMRKSGNTFFATVACIGWQISLNLLGKSDSTTTLIGEAMDETSPIYAEMPYKMLLEAWKSYMYVIFGDFETGAEDAMRRGDVYATTAVGMMYGMETFHRGMSLYAMARKGKAKYKAAAFKVRKQLKEWVRKGCINLAGPTILLSAEHAALSGNHGKAVRSFQDAIDTCSRGEFHQFVGLSLERYATYLAEKGDFEASSEQLRKAAQSYRRWGAFHKVQILQANNKGIRGGRPEMMRNLSTSTQFLSALSSL